ncbi:cell wall hydrolase/autolysin [Calothrix sp. NIES-4071]|nr:cell wall hydrolase/autolysin [Calothrix sp. NIES-4071]BAZ62684.1 cell wall hydrolase/autolysin [Calothrix sp. NIES-4105]
MFYLFNGVKPVLGLFLFSLILTSQAANATEQSLKVVYPRTNHKTSADRIFFIGTAPSTGQVFINGKLIQRSSAGHFAPSLPLQIGENNFTFRYQNQELLIKVTRVGLQPEIPQGVAAFAPNSLTPAVDIARLPGETVCFSAVAPPSSNVSVKLGNQTVSLSPQPQTALLPDNKAALTGRNQPITASSSHTYSGCTTVGSNLSFKTPLYRNNISNTVTPDTPTLIDLGKPEFQLTLNGKTITTTGTGKITVLPTNQLQVAEVTSDAGVARTGPSTDFSRLTPLPKGTRVSITGRDGDWLRLDYGAWINGKETRIIPGAVAPSTIIRSVGYRNLPGKTEIVFPLQAPVPVSVVQGDKSLVLTLYNTTAQTDTFRTDDNPIISRLDWQQVNPNQVQYTFNLKKNQQWGYKLRYEGTSLILTMRHPPIKNGRKPLSGVKVLLDPGHGGAESGASGPEGTLEKDVNLVISRLIRDDLIKRGATVVMTRDSDVELSLVDRQKIIDNSEPTIALSIHHNSLPDNGDAENIKGFGTFWYNTQAHDLALFLHNYVVKKLNRPSYGVFWNNLALTRPASSPSVLLELGFMSNPNEIQLIVDPSDQKKMAQTITDGIVEWFNKTRKY